MSVIGGLNNVNRRLYGWDEMATLQSFEITPFNANSRNTMWWTGGVKTRFGGGANLHFEPQDKMEVDLAYVLTDESNIRESDRIEEVFLEELSLRNTSRTEANGAQASHQLNGSLEWEIDTLNKLVVRTQLSKQAGSGFEYSRAMNAYLDGTTINSGVNKDGSDQEDQKMAAKIHWTKKRRTKTSDHFMGSVYVSSNAFENRFDSYYKTDTSLLPFPTSEAPILNQQLFTQDRTLATTTAYQFKINDKVSLRPGWNYMVTEYDHEFKWRAESDGLLPSKKPNRSGGGSKHRVLCTHHTSAGQQYQFTGSFRN